MALICPDSSPVIPDSRIGTCSADVDAFELREETKYPASTLTDSSVPSNVPLLALPLDLGNLLGSHEEGLSLRLFTLSDAPTLSAYRNETSVALYQLWPLPFTLAAAEALISESAVLGGPAPGSWVNLAIVYSHKDDSENRGCGRMVREVVGDVAVGLSSEGDAADVGFTVRPEFQGRGFATQAARGLIAALQRFSAVRKVGASIDPRNGASLAVLTKLGFRHVRTDRDACTQRGQLVDDAVYELLI